MGRMFVTGDIHGSIDISKLNTKNFPIQKELTKDDIVICCGDFGLVWNNSNEDLYWRKWLKNKSFTTVFVDGNHENHDLLDAYPIECWNGGKVHKINDSVIHLMRGQVYEINGKKVFTFGGAVSTDKIYRREGISWWSREMPNKNEMDEGLINLETHNNCVDYIFTHTCSSSSLRLIDRFHYLYEADGLNRYLEHIRTTVKFRHWYFGHFHDDKQIDDNESVIYKNIIELK